MARGAYFYLRDDEEVLARVRPPFAYALTLLLPPALALSVLLAIYLVARSNLPGLPVAASTAWTIWAVLLGLVALVSWRRQATSEYAITDQRIYSRTGQLVTAVHFTTHDKITDMRFRQGPIERAFGLSGLTFATAGGDVHFAGSRDAMRLKGMSESARDAFIRKLLAEVPAAAATPAPPLHADAQEPAVAHAPAPLPEPLAFTGPLPPYLQTGDVPVWHAKPRPIAAVGALRSLFGLIPFLVFSSFMEGPNRVWIPIAATGLVLMFIAVRFAQLRRTEYVATQRRVYARAGLVGTTVNQLTYDKITDITFHQDLLGRIFGYGSVTLQTAGSNQAPITMVGLPAPLVAKETVERWRDAAVGA